LNGNILPVYKVVVVGDGNVGKTSLIRRYCDGKFELSRTMTIGVDFQTKLVQIGASRFKLSIWDVAGQDRFESFRESVYLGAHAVALVYDCTEPESFAHLERWRAEVLANHPGVPMALIANKVDLCARVATEAGQRWARRHRMPFIETSAASGLNVAALFDGLARLAVQEPAVVG
jgi:small GTP-binding protein